MGRFTVDGYARDNKGSVYLVVQRTEIAVTLKLNKRHYHRRIHLDQDGNEYVYYLKSGGLYPYTGVIWPMN